MTALLDAAQGIVSAWSADLIDGGTKVAALVVAHPIVSCELTFVVWVAAALRMGSAA